MYDRYPSVPAGNEEECSEGWNEIAQRIAPSIAEQRSVICVECYPGADVRRIASNLQHRLKPTLTVFAEDAYHSPDELNSRFDPLLTDDPVFGKMNSLEILDFFDPRLLEETRQRLESRKSGLLLIVGTGASLVSRFDRLVYADMTRWELQQRQRRNQIGNLGADNIQERSSLKYKRAFFVDWRAADRLKRGILHRIDFLLDTNRNDEPKMISGDALRKALAATVRRPFRLVPFFDPGPWGGHWMEQVCGLPEDGAPNHAWCFDGVPEENSLFLAFGNKRVEIPSINLVFQHPAELLGEHVFQRFGAEFPIRFDFLDTMGGSNLSLQVHPLTKYVREKFGLQYTQDESYYLLDAGPDAAVYLGLRERIDPQRMIADLEEAQSIGSSFPAEQYVNTFPARKHDHFLIPAGTVHCSGANCMVLEISATPYIFTFKLWDWGRLGLDGRPRPIHLKHGIENIQWDRTTGWVRENLVNQIELVCSGDGWQEERTGLHELEFIETRRHWFTSAVQHDTSHTGVHVLNLVEGKEAIVESPDGAFEPFVVHYAETFIVPASVGRYTLRPSGESAGERCATVMAYVRQESAPGSKTGQRSDTRAGSDTH
jgi:mannose-6-phosphate isomerase class I